MALIAGSIVSSLLCVLVYMVPQILRHLFPICITAAFVSYTGQCIGYLSLKKHYRNIKSSSFVNPFGIYGALFSMSVWLLCFLSIAAFQGDSQLEILAFVGLVLFLVVFYYGYSKKRQTFSPQENKILLVAHVMKFNANRSQSKVKSGHRRSSLGASVIASIKSIRSEY
jgi:L-asparagine transporter-like permease